MSCRAWLRCHGHWQGTAGVYRGVCRIDSSERDQALSPGHDDPGDGVAALPQRVIKIASWSWVVVGAGDVRLRERSVVGTSPTTVARLGVSRTFQTPRLVPNLSALENVMVGGGRHHRLGHIAELFGLPAARHDERAQRERARDLLATFGLGAHPERQASGFPIGSQKIIEVARALLNDPVLLLLDEPAAGLGAEDVDTLVEGLNGWTRAHPEAAVMIIEHDLELITRLCPRVAVLHFGRIIQAGAPKDVLRDPVVVEAYLGADVAAGD